MRANCLLRLPDEQLSVVVEEAVERLKDFRRCEVELVEDDPVAVAHRIDQRTFAERRKSGKEST